MDKSWKNFKRKERLVWCPFWKRFISERKLEYYCKPKNCKWVKEIK